jgi:ribonuclease P protein component
MSEDRSNRTNGNRLPRRAILRGKDSFDQLFKNGIRIAAGQIDLRYQIRQGESHNTQVAFIVGRKTGNAVIRNRCKRLLREAYRLQQHILDPILTHRSSSINMALIVKSAELTYATAMADVQKLLTSLVRRLQETGEPT